MHQQHLQDEETVNDSYGYKSSGRRRSSNSTWEIEEEEEEEELVLVVNHRSLEPIKEESTDTISSCCSSSLFSFDVHNNNNNNNNHHINNKGNDDEEKACVYHVGIGGGNKVDDQSSVEALTWTLNNLAAAPTSSTVCLVHVFPQTHFIPSPVGKLPKSQVSPKLVNNYMAQERGKRRQYLQKFLNMCIASKVKVDTVVIESDMVAREFLDLIGILNIRKLVLGTTKSSLRRSKNKRGSGLIDQILQNAPEYCEIKIICEGKEVNDQIINGSPSPRRAAAAAADDDDDVGDNAESIDQVRPTTTDSFACMCFKPPRVV